MPRNLRLGFSRLWNSLTRRRRPAAPVPASRDILQLPCRADLWCRHRTSLSTLLDPDLYDLYKTGDDRIDEDWIIQSNPPCAFKAEFRDGCDALLALLEEDRQLHATKGWLNYTPSARIPLGESVKANYLRLMATVVRVAERELKHE